MARVKLPDGRIVQTFGRRPKEVACKRSYKKSQVRNSTLGQTQKLRTDPTLRQDVLSSELDDIPRRHGASHRGKSLNQWNASDMLGALGDWQREKDLPIQEKHSLREISRAWGVPYATFRRRIVDVPSRTRSRVLDQSGYLSGRPTILSKTAEDQLAEHIRQLAATGFPCDRVDVRNLAYDYAKANNVKGFSTEKSCAGYYWFRGFLDRHPELVMKKAENLSVQRAMAMNGTQVLKWFQEYDTLITKLGIKDVPSHIWNCDETGCQNIHRTNDVVGVVGKQSYNITALEKGETSTALVTINAVGDAPPVMIIHRGKNIGKQWSNGAPHDTLVRASEKGYINKELFLEYGISFVKYLEKQQLNDGRPHLILMDSHYSHLYNLEFLELMKLNNVHVFAIPAHTSHWLQPLDRGIFSSFKQAWQREMKSFTRDTAGRKLEKKDFFLIFNPAFNKSVNVENAQGAFRGTGLFPFNEHAIPDRAFEPSTTSERELVPDSALPNVELSLVNVEGGNSSSNEVTSARENTPNQSSPASEIAADVSNKSAPDTLPELPQSNVEQNDVAQSSSAQPAENSTGLISIESPGPSQGGVTFHQLLPLPRRQRPLSKNPRKRPPSYELTSDSTIDFVRDHVQKKSAKLPKNENKIDKATKKSRSKKKCAGARRWNTAGDRTRDIVPCGVCKVRCCDDDYQRNWIQCQECQVWYHYDCQGLNDRDRLNNFTCIACEDLE